MSTYRKVVGECLFLNVGQGSANVIRMRDRQAFLIDAGPKGVGAFAVREYLRRRSVDEIHCVLLSHNDQDHIGGVEGLIKEFGHQIRRIMLIEDRELGRSGLFDLVFHFARSGIIPRPVRAEVEHLGKAKIIWKRSDGMRVKLLYPDMTANLNAREMSKANLTCAIVVVEWQGRRIVFPGDSKIGAWRSLIEQGGELPIQDVDVLAIPHHGGLFGSSGTKGQRESLDWFVQNVCLPKCITVSVGSNNPHGHPRREIVEFFRDKGCRIICTQITTQCCETASDLVGLAVFKGGPESSFRRQVAPEAQGVNCHGTVLTRFLDDGIQVVREREHVVAVRNNVPTPMCIWTSQS